MEVLGIFCRFRGWQKKPSLRRLGRRGKRKTPTYINLESTYSIIKRGVQGHAFWVLKRAPPFMKNYLWVEKGIVTKAYLQEALLATQELVLLHDGFSCEHQFVFAQRRLAPAGIHGLKAQNRTRINLQRYFTLGFLRKFNVPSERTLLSTSCANINIWCKPTNQPKILTQVLRRPLLLLFDESFRKRFPKTNVG